MENRSLIADHPAVFFVDEGDRIQMSSGARWPRSPIFPARSSCQNSAARSHGPTTRAVQKKDIRQVVAPASGQTLPTKSAIVAAHDQTVVAACPASVFVREVNRHQPGTGFDACRQPQASAICSAEHDSVVAGNPAVLLIRKGN